MTQQRVTDIHIDKRILLDRPAEVADKRPTSDAVRALVQGARDSIGAIIDGTDKRVLVVVGPCSIHDKESALEYAKRLAVLRSELSDELFVVMRMCPHKPRTVSEPGSWEGLYPDPDMDGSHDVHKGIILARDIALSIMELGVPIGTELLDDRLVQYLPPLPLAWIGARTVQDPNLRKLASGLSAPCGFKNTTAGDTTAAIDAVESARHVHWFSGIDDETGRAGLFQSTGNDRGFVILRGGSQGPNHDLETVRKVSEALRERNLPEFIVIDASHANSHKDHRRQPKVVRETLAGHEAGHRIGLMIESHIKDGKQSFKPAPGVRDTLDPNVSVTDACLGWEDTAELLRGIAASVRKS